jgi:hypothetical protein
MKISAFSPPANVDDFDAIPHQREAWSEFLNFRFDLEVGRLAGQYGGGATPHFYNPLRGNGATDKVVTQQRPWQGFPNVLAVRYGDVKYDFADAPLTTTIGYTNDGTAVAGLFRQQDEYLEWFVERDQKSGKITRITFTCEAPEYWSAFAQGYPSPYYVKDDPKDPDFNPTAGARGSMTAVLEVYQTLVGGSAKIDPADLVFHTDIYNAPPGDPERLLYFKKDDYNPYNRWNTTAGAIHLTHPANTLGAEINLAAQASIRRTRGGNVEPVDAVHMICCSGYGGASRNSDPAIGFFVNGFTRVDSFVTLLDPVALYMTSFNSAAFKAPDGGDVAEFFRVLRPSVQIGDGFNRWLRAEFSVPAGRGYVVGDITTAGNRPITSGGMVADQITMMLVGAVDGIGTIKTPLLKCPNKGCKSALRNGLFAILRELDKPCISLGDFEEFDDLPAPVGGAAPGVASAAPAPARQVPRVGRLSRRTG